MKIIGITGGIGSGKTAALKVLKEEYGAYVLEADALAHHLMEPGEVSYRAIVDAFGEGILKENGEIDRRVLGNIVFSDDSKLQLLNSITHPNVKKAILCSIKQQRASDCRLYVLEAALLIQDGYMDICDEMWFIYASYEVRIERLCKYRKYTRESAMQVIANQESDSFYEANCSKKIDNSGNLSELRVQIKAAL